MSITKLIKEYNTMIVQMAILVIITIGVSKAQFHNGRLNMCTELGKYYTQDSECVSCEESGRIMLNGECMMPINKNSPEYIKNRYLEGLNGTIL